MTEDEAMKGLHGLWILYNEGKYPGTTWEKLLLEHFKDHKHLIQNYDDLYEFEYKQKQSCGMKKS